MLQFYLSVLQTEEERSEFERLYLEYKNQMYNVAVSYLHDPVDAEDAVHEAFLRIAHKKARVFDVSSEKRGAFLYALVRNISMDMFTKKISHREQEYSDALCSVPDDAATLEDMVLGRIDFKSLVEFIRTMPTATKDTMYMKYICRMENSDISHALEISENAVRQRLYAGRQMIKNYVECIEAKAVSARSHTDE